MGLSSLELKRQLIHASGVFIAIILREIHEDLGWLIPGVALAVVIFVGYAISNLHRKQIEMPFLTRLIEEAEREKDREFPGRGAIRFFTGSLLTLLVFRGFPDVVASGIIVLALGDSASTIGGLSFGRNKIPYNPQKSIEGSLSGVAAAALGLLIFAPYAVVIAIAASFAGMVVESLPTRIDDNVSVPLAAGITVWILSGAIVI